MSEYRAHPFTDAIVALLAATGYAVGDGEKPRTNAGWVGDPMESDFHGYLVVHPIGAYDIDGTIDNPSDDVWPLHQVTAYGATRAQCEEVADSARAMMLGNPLTVSGRHVGKCRLDLQGTVMRVDDVPAQGPLYMEPDRYTAFSTPG